MIRANELSIADFINYYQQDVESFLNEQRMMITSVDAWGILRKDLIETLGVERAKRYLLRYGRHCGRVEARMLKEMFDWKDDLEWLMAGTKMHKITGRAFSNLIKFDASFEEGRFDVEGFWINSYEAKQHIQHFSLYHDPICFFLIGWAGGYCSESLGKPVYFKEAECMGKGDSHCRYIGKTLELWGDEIKEDLVEYEEDLSDELDRVYRRVEKQKEALKLGSSISQKLTKSMLQGKRLNVFAEIINSDLHCPVVIENQYLVPIATAGTIKDEQDNETLKAIFSNTSVKEARENLLQTHSATKVEIEHDSEKYFVLIAPIVIRKKVNGFVSLVRSERNFDELEIDILERIATICAVQMLNEQTAIETEQRLKGELLEELFNENGDSSVISSKFASLGYNINAPHYVLVFQIDASLAGNESVQDEQRYLSIRNRITEKLRKELDSHGYRPLISTKLNAVHTIINAEMLDKMNLSIKEFAQSYVNFANESRSQLYIGISSLTEDYTKYYKMYQEAYKAIEIAKMKAKESTIVMASDLGHLTLLLDARNPRELEEFASDKLKNVFEYDEQNNSEFLKTLYHYIQCECNLYKTAREMNVSISGMRYRMKRIEELLNVDLSTSSTRFELQLALEIFLVFGKLDL